MGGEVTENNMAASSLSGKHYCDLCLLHEEVRKMVDENSKENKSIRELTVEMNKSCFKMREKCRLEMVEAISARPTGKMLVSLTVIFVMIALASLTLFSVFTSTSISGVKEAVAELKESDKKMTKKMDSIQRSLFKISLGEKLTQKDLPNGEGDENE